MKDKTIAILYLASGGYIAFWQEFYKSCEKYFLKDYNKTYFVFTDAKNFKYCNNENVKVIERPHLGWPDGTLLRYHEFLKHEKELEKYDYIFFFNANMEIVAPIDEEILPNDKNDGLIMGLHPAFYNKSNEEFTYDRNPNSTAYIPKGEGKYYVQGCLNGGTSKAFLELCKVCAKNIEIDKNNNVEALWLDESHLNKYVLDKNPLIMPCNYLYPETWDLKEFKNDIKIIQRDKSNPKYGGINYLRGTTNKKQEYYDVVICLAKKDANKNFKFTLDLLKKNANFRNIVVISNDKLDISDERIKYINENDILEGLSYKAIEKYFLKRNVKPSRIGWYLQQFIKMAYCYKSDLDNYLVWDSDTLMLKRINFFDDDNRILYDNSRVWKDEVFNKNVLDVLGYERGTKETYIVEHMMINKDCMKHLISEIASKNNVEIKDFYKAILDKISDKDLIYGGFSEFELIGTFMKQNYPDKIAFRPLKSNRNFANLVGKKINRYDIFALEKDYDFGSFEQIHKLQNTPFKIFKNKLRNIRKYYKSKYFSRGKR